MREIMRHLVIIGLVFICGCTAHREREEAKAVWSSPHSTPEERVDAVAKLVRVGTPASKVQRILGTNGRWVHYHGPSIEFYVSNGVSILRETGQHDEWKLEFPVEGGSIMLSFAKPPSGRGELRFVGAGLSRELSPGGKKTGSDR
jgi:hypothetical protein